MSSVVSDGYSFARGQHVGTVFVTYNSICYDCGRNFGQHYGPNCWNDGRKGTFLVKPPYPRRVELPEGI